MNKRRKTWSFEKSARLYQKFPFSALSSFQMEKTLTKILKFSSQFSGRIKQKTQLLFRINCAQKTEHRTCSLPFYK